MSMTTQVKNIKITGQVVKTQDMTRQGLSWHTKNDEVDASMKT